MARRLSWGITAWLLMACTKAPPEFAIRDPRINDAQRGWLVDAQDEVAIAQARIDDARRTRAQVTRHNELLLDRVKAADGAVAPWQALSRSRETLAELELRLARVRDDHAQARLKLVRAEVAVAADLAVIKLAPLRADVDRHHARLVELVGEVEQATTEMENRADETWAGWQRHLGTRGPANGFFQDVDASGTVGAGTEPK